MSPKEAIIASTRNGAQAVGLSDKVGTLEKGKLADIIAVDGDPLSNIDALMDKDRIVLVMKEGKIFKKKL